MKVHIFAAAGTDSVPVGHVGDFKGIYRYRIRTCSAFFQHMAGTESVLLLRVSMLSLRNRMIQGRLVSVWWFMLCSYPCVICLMISENPGGANGWFW